MIEELVPNKFYLGQNLPVPVKAETDIKYCLPVKSNVKIRIFNSSGDIVKQLVNDVQEAGTYEIKVNLNDLLNGQYYYELEAVDLGSGQNKIFRDTKKMIL